MAKTTKKNHLASPENYDHKEQQALIRPDVGLQALPAFTTKCKELLEK